VPNDGNEAIVVPAITNSSARVMVSCSDNVFYAISPSNFQVSGPSAPTITSITDGSATEGGNIVITFTLDATTTTTSIYPLEINNINASNSDYVSLSFSNGVTDNGNQTISVPTGVSTFTLTVPTIDDTSFEPDETFRIVSGSQFGTATIIDNDIQFGVSSISDGSVVEGETIILPVTLTTPAAPNTFIGLSLTNNSISDNDIGQLSFSNGVTLDSFSSVLVPAGISSFTISVPTVDDNEVENDETFTINLASETATGTITDNDTGSGGSGGGGGGSLGIFFTLLLGTLVFIRRKVKVAV
jgi:hypothetical protein